MLIKRLSQATGIVSLTLCAISRIFSLIYFSILSSDLILSVLHYNPSIPQNLWTRVYQTTKDHLKGGQISYYLSAL